MPRRPGYLIVSDLHLSSGHDPETGHISRTEDFLFDDEFCAFLDHYGSDPAWQDIAWTLVIAGDFMDFLQVVEVPAAPRRLRSDSMYGLKAGAAESAWKLEKICAGHEGFFRELAEFVIRHRLIIVSGNHDIEFTYPEVRRRLIECLARFGGRGAAEIEPRVRFRPWFHFDGEVYIEHGNQYDSFNSFRSMLEPRLPESEDRRSEASEDLELPPGSLFVRYLFNRVETDSPFADNIKPATRFLAWVAVHHPLRSLSFLFTDGREMLRRFRTKWRREAPEAYRSRDETHQESLRTVAEALGQQLSERAPAEWEAVAERIHRLSSAPFFQRGGALSPRWIRVVIGPYRTPILALLLAIPILLTGIQAASALLSGILPSILLTPLRFLEAFVPSAAWESARWLTLTEAGLGLALARRATRPGRDRLHLRRIAAAIQQETAARVVVMGHTHEPDLWPLADGARYFNLGTWTKVFSQEDRVIREEKELTFLQILPSEKGPKAKLLKWEGQRGEARLAYVFNDLEIQP